MRLEESVVVDRPIGEVWAAMAKLFDAPRLWGPRILGMRQTSPGPLGVGATMRGRMVMLGFETGLDVLITEWDPPHRLVMLMSGRPFGSVDTRYTLETVGKGTRLTRSGEIEGRGAMRVVFPLLRPLLMRGMRDASRSLKRFIESRPRSV